MTLIWLWVASWAVIALAFWLDHRSPGSGSTIGGATVVTGFCILIAATLSRGVEMRAVDRYQARVIETVLEWASSQPGRLARSVDGLPNVHGGYEPDDWKICVAASTLCVVPAVAALLHPSPEARMPLGDLRFFAAAESGITYRGASLPTAHNWKRPH